MKDQAGFTLVELLMVVTVAAILLGVGVPSFQRMILTNQRAAATNEIIAAINAARSEAVKRNGQIGLCPSTSGAACTGGTQWEDGWMTYVDTNDSESFDSGEEILAVGAPIEGTTVHGTFAGITYRSNGRMITSANAEQAEFILCDDRGPDDASVILIWISGRPQASDTTLANAAPSTCSPS